MEYGSKDIKSLSDLEAIREKKGMYIGEANHPAHLFQEVIDNAVDESLAGSVKNIEVVVDTKDSIYEVRDDGRGFPLGSMKIEIMGHVFEKQSLELMVSKTHTGGKLGGTKGYSISGGTHGVGLKCLSALSDLFEVETYRVHEDTKKFTKALISYSRGKLVNQSYEEVKKRPTGAIVRFKADPTIFNSIEIPLSYIEAKCKLIKAFGHSISLKVDNEDVDLGKGGIESLLHFEESKPISDFVEIEVKKGEEFARFGIQYADDITSNTRGFSNMLYNSQGGTHVRLFERAIIKAWRTVVDKDTNNKLKDWDFMIGCKSIVACFLLEPSYSSQTKERLVTHNTFVQPLLDLFTNDYVKYLYKHKDYVDKMVAKFIAFRDSQNTLLNSKEIRGLVKVAEVAQGGKVRRRSVVDGLIECSNPLVGETELFITEGQSALGSIQQARDPRIHAGFPLRGKALNVAGMDIVSVIKNKEMLGIVNAIGCGLGEASDHKKSRYGKVIITADADIDGYHIRTLVLSALINLIPDLVKAGMVYIAPGYLYGYYDKKGNFNGCDKKEDIPKDAKSWTRNKGLGELNPQEFFDFYMDKSKRQLLQVKYPESITDFNNLMNYSKRDLLIEDEIIIYER